MPSLRAIPHPRSTRPLLAALATLLAACGGARSERLAAESAGVDLLRRRPDAVLVQSGELVPTDEAAWGEYDRGGWGEWVSRPGGGEPVVWTMNRVSRLVLSAGPPRDRTLVLRSLAPAATLLPGEEPAPGDVEPGEEAEAEERGAFVRVRLNGTGIGHFDLTRELSDAALAAPAAVWRQGQNLLEFEVSRMSLGAGKYWHGFGLASVRYDRPIQVRAFPDAERLVLGPSGGVEYTLVSTSGSRLELAGRSEGAGRLEVHLRGIEPTTGAAVPLAEEPLRFDVEDGALSVRVPLPPAGDDVLGVQLDWVARGEHALEVDRFEWLQDERRERPPIFFVSVDTLAARNMSLYGYARSTTPNLEAFAAEGVTFENCRANAPRTLRSYLSQLSGLYPESHYVENETSRRWRPPVEEHQLAPNRWTLPELLRAGGWTTAAWVDNPWLINGVGLRQGFDVYDVSAGEIDHWGEGSDPDGGIRHIVPEVEAWLRSQPSGVSPFVFVQVLDVHGPYLPVEPWKGRFRGDALYDGEREEPVARDMVDVFGMVPTYIARGVHREGDLPERIRTGPLHASYDEKILELDAEVGRFFDLLRELGLYDRSIIVFSADHGESILDHDFYFGHGTLYGESLDVPLVVRLPGGEHGGRRVGTPVQLVDLYPTIAELAGLPDGGVPHGRSLVPALRGADLEPVPLLADGGIMTQFALEYDGWKLIESWPAQASFQTMLTHERVDPALLDQVPGLRDAMGSNRSLRLFFEEHPDRFRHLATQLEGPIRELYHVAQDREERNDLAREHPERLAALSSLLAEERARVEAARGHAARLAVPVELDAEEIERLTNLGYLEGDEHQEAPAGGTPSEDYAGSDGSGEVRGPVGEAR